MSPDKSVECLFRFHGGLEIFLAPAARRPSLRYRFRGTPAVKDAIEALGPPHTEVDVILVDGASVGFERRLCGGERVDVFTARMAPANARLNHLQPPPLRRPRFVVDVHLGTLARHLRLLGFDSAYDRAAGDTALVRRALDERRILLTRDIGLLKHRVLRRARFVRAVLPAAQLREIVAAFDLAPRLRPFTRCTICNGRLRPVSGASVAAELPPRVRQAQRRFARCALCRRIYWPGTHYDRLRAIVEARGAVPADTQTLLAR